MLLPRILVQVSLPETRHNLMRALHCLAYPPAYGSGGQHPSRAASLRDSLGPGWEEVEAQLHTLGVAAAADASGDGSLASNPYGLATGELFWQRLYQVGGAAWII